MKLTREQRLEIYKLAKDVYMSEDNNKSGICIELSKALYQLHGEYVSYPITGTFPELESVKLNITRDGLFWWPLEDIDSRLKAFDRMIELASK